MKSFVTHHLYGRGSACFHPRQHSASVKAFHLLPENMQRLHNGVGNFPRQQPTQIRRHHATGITWRNVKNCRFCVGKEVRYVLAGGNVIALTAKICVLFQLFLKAQTCKTIVAETPIGNVVSRYRYHQSAVAVGFCSGKIAHSVYHHGVWCGICAHYHSSGTHTKGIATAFPHVVDKFVTCRSQIPVCGKNFTVLHFVDKFPWVFHSQTDGKRFELHLCSVFLKRNKHFPCAVSAAKRNAIGKKRLPFALFDVTYAPYRAIFFQQIIHESVKNEFSSPSHNFVAHVFHNAHKFVGTYVRQRRGQNLFGCACSNKLFKHRVSERGRNTRCQFAVGKCSCATQTELHVTFAVELSSVKKALHLLAPFGDVASSLHNGYTHSAVAQVSCKKQSRRAATHHYATADIHLLGVFQQIYGRSVALCISFGRFCALHKIGTHKMHVLFFACVDALFFQLYVGNLTRQNAQQFGKPLLYVQHVCAHRHLDRRSYKTIFHIT